MSKKHTSVLSKEDDTIYISGPMSGIPDMNSKAFYEAEDHLRKLGFENIINPFRLDDELRNRSGRSYSEIPAEFFLRRDIEIIASRCTALVVLDGWKYSRGSRLEVFVARRLGCRIFSYPDLNEIDASFLPEHAVDVVYGYRYGDYGPYTESLSRIAGMWTALLGDRLREGISISPRDVCMMMILLKMVREEHAHKDDNIIDLIGYAEMLGNVNR